MDTCRIQQAIFTSADDGQPGGYHVVAASPGIDPIDLEEITTWGPTQSSMLAVTPESVSLNYHPLPSGSYCIGRTSPVGISGAGHVKLYTQNLIVAPDEFLKFRNHPVRLFQSALQHRVLRWYDDYPATLRQIELPADPTIIDRQLLGELARTPGAEWIGVLMQTMLDSVTVGITGGPPSMHVISGLLGCLPIECRAELTFSTGLRFTPKRPFRMLGLTGSPDEQDRVQRLYNLTVLDLDMPSPEVNDLFESWPQLMYRVMHIGDWKFLERCLDVRRPGMTLDELPLLGLEWMEEFDRTSLSRFKKSKGHRREPLAGNGNGHWAEALSPSLEDQLDPAESPDASAFRESCEKPAGELAEEPFEEIAAFDATSDGSESDDSSINGITPDVFPGQKDDGSFTVKDFEKLILHAGGKIFGPTTGSLSYKNADADLQALTPSCELGRAYPELADDLQRLDTIVYNVVVGNDAAMTVLTGFWEQFEAKIDDPQVMLDVCERYIQYVLELLNGKLDPSKNDHFEVMANSLDFICFLNGKV